MGQTTAKCLNRLQVEMASFHGAKPGRGEPDRKRLLGQGSNQLSRQTIIAFSQRCPLPCTPLHGYNLLARYVDLTRNRDWKAAKWAISCEKSRFPTTTKNHANKLYPSRGVQTLANGILACFQRPGIDDGAWSGGYICIGLSYRILQGH